MQNILINMCEKFHNDRLRNDRSPLGNRKSDNNNNRNRPNKHKKNNVRSAWRPVSAFPRPKSNRKNITFIFFFDNDFHYMIYKSYT